MSHRPAPFVVTLIAEAPAATIESVRLDLLDVARLYGYTDVSVEYRLSGFGPLYSATAYTRTHAPTTLANCLDHDSLPAMRAAALETLYALSGNGCAQL